MRALKFQACRKDLFHRPAMEKIIGPALLRTRDHRRVTNWSCCSALRQCSPVRQANTFWLFQIDQRDDRQDCATQHFQGSERHDARDKWHSSKREPSGQRAIPKKPAISGACHGHPSHLWASPSKSQPTQPRFTCNQKDNGASHFVLEDDLSHPLRNGLYR
jgi:hypothetical protein